MAKHPVFVKTKQLVIFSLNTAKKNSNQIKTSSRLTYIFFLSVYPRLATHLKFLIPLYCKIS